MQDNERAAETRNGESRASEAAAIRVKELAGKYLTFVMADGEYGLAVRKVREIIKLPPITAVPQVSPWVKGVINLRGKVIPVLDLRLKFEVAASDYTDRTCIIVVDVALKSHAMLMGIIVDSVSDVMNVAADELEDVPGLSDRTTTGYIDGLAKVKGTVKILLNVDRVCGPDAETGRLAPSVISS
jgi:purine-binding chemotaxis protein CheW